MENNRLRKNQYYDEDAIEALKADVQRSLEDIAHCRCPHELVNNYDRFKAMSPSERIALFHGLRSNNMDLKHAITEEPQALIGNSDIQVEVKEALYERGYSEVEVLQRTDMPRRINIDVIKGHNDKFLFSRDRILWKCKRVGLIEEKDSDERIIRDSDGKPMLVEGEIVDHVIKRSHFIGDIDFVNLLNLDTNFLALSDRRTLECEKLLDNDTSKVIPHSVLYYIKNGTPDNICPSYTEKQIKHILDLFNSEKNETRSSFDQSDQVSVDTLWIR